MSYHVLPHKTADYLLSLGFEQVTKDSFMRKYRKHNGRIEAQLIVLDSEGNVVQGVIPPYKAILRTFGSEKFREPSVWDRLEQYGEMQLP